MFIPSLIFECVFFYWREVRERITNVVPHVNNQLTIEVEIKTGG